MTIANADNKGSKSKTDSEVVIRQDEEFPEFVPTRYELVELAKHFARANVEARWFDLCYGVPWKIGRENEADEINRIEAVLGKDEVDKATNEVYEQFRREKEETFWDLFLHRTRLQWEAVWWDRSQKVYGPWKREDKAVPAKVQGGHAKARAEAT